MAGGVIAALTAQGLAGKVPVSGQDGDHAALNRVALGTQTVDVWKDARELGKAAGEAAVAAVRRTKDINEGRRAPAPFTTPGRQRASPSILLTPTRSPRTTSRSSSTPAGSPRTTLCKGVTPARSTVCG